MQTWCQPRLPCGRKASSSSSSQAVADGGRWSCWGRRLCRGFSWCGSWMGLGEGQVGDGAGGLVRVGVAAMGDKQGSDAVQSRQMLLQAACTCQWGFPLEWQVVCPRPPYLFMRLHIGLLPETLSSCLPVVAGG